MPELPEVETIRKAAEARLAGRVITGVDVRNPQLRRPVDIQGLQAACTGKTITGIDRRGKFMIVRLDRKFERFLGDLSSNRLFFGQNVG